MAVIATIGAIGFVGTVLGVFLGEADLLREAFSIELRKVNRLMATRRVLENFLEGNIPGERGPPHAIRCSAIGRRDRAVERVVKQLKEDIENPTNLNGKKLLKKLRQVHELEVTFLERAKSDVMEMQQKEMRDSIERLTAAAAAAAVASAPMLSDLDNRTIAV